MASNRYFNFLISIMACLAFVSVTGSTLHSQEQNSQRKLTDAQFKDKYEQLTRRMERVEKLIKNGYMPRANIEAMATVGFAEDEFGPNDIILIKPLLDLVEILGIQKRYEEAENSIAKIYTITESGSEADRVYAIGYRLRIARLYLQWNMFEKSESTLMTAKDIVNASKQPLAHYIQAIDFELEKIALLKEANRYKRKK